MGGPGLKEVGEENPGNNKTQEGDVGEEQGVALIPARLP